MNAQPNPPTRIPAATATVGTMQAMVQERYGEAEDVLHLATIDRPKIGDGDVLVRVHAAGVDRGVWHLTAGLPYPVRLISGLRTPKARVPWHGRPVQHELGRRSRGQLSRCASHADLAGLTSRSCTRVTITTVPR
jgi:hypothetical protein